MKYPQAGFGQWTREPGISPACVACAFGPDRPTWHPFVEIPGDRVRFAAGACVAIASGNEACGAAYQRWYACAVDVCEDCVDIVDAAAAKGCFADVSTGACKPAHDDLVAQCGAALDAAEKSCAGAVPFDGSMRAQCIAGLGDQ